MRKFLFFVGILIGWGTAVQSQPALQTVIQRGHDQTVLAVACSPDSRYAASGSRDRTAKLWELATGREIRTFFGHEGSVNDLAFSADGQYLLTSSSDATARIWEVETGTLVFTTPPEKKLLTTVAFSPDMQYFITGGYPSEAKIWRFDTKEVVKTLPVNADQGLGYGIHAAFSLDGQWLVIGEDNHVATVYETGTWDKRHTFTRETGRCGGCATWVAFSHDSRFLLMASNRGPVKQYRLSDGLLIRRYTDAVEDDLASLLITPDDKVLYVATETTLLPFDMDSGKALPAQTLPEKINQAALIHKGKEILLAQPNNVIVVWSLAHQKGVSRLSGILNERDKGGVTYDPNSYWQSHIARYLRLKNELLLTADGKDLIKGGFGTQVKRWDMATGRTQMAYVGHDKAAVCYTLSANGSRLLTGGADGKVILWDMASGDTLKVIQAHREPVFSVRFSHDERQILTSSWDATLKVFDLTTGERLRYFDFNNASAYDALFSGNDLYAFTSQLDLTLKMWELDTQRAVREFIGHTDVVSTIALSADQTKLLSASWDGSVRLWDIATGLMDKKLTGHRGPVYVAQFSHNTAHIFSGGADRVVRMWDVVSGQEVRTFEGHQAEVTSILQSRDGTMLITHSTDGVTKFWDMKTGREFFEHIHLGTQDWMVKTTDGYFNGTDAARRAIHFVNGMKTYAVDQFFHEFYRPDLLPTIFNTRGGEAPKETIEGKLEKSPLPTLKLATVKSENPSLLEVYIRVMDEGGGVSGLTLFHNGKNIPLSYDAKELPRGKGAFKVFKQVVQLVGGTNIFTALATNRDRIETDPVSIEFFSEHGTKLSRCHVLAVGINHYENISLALQYARPDAEAFVSLLEEKTKGLFESIEVVTLYDDDASASKILATMDSLSEKIHPEDVFIFYYAGHGSMVDNKFFFIPFNGKRLYDLKSLEKEAIEARVLQEKLRHIQALKQLIVMDACQSGASAELLATRGGVEEKAIAQLSRSAGIHVLAAAGSDQFATEFAALGHGLFTYVLMRALMGEADGAPKDGKVTIYEIKSFIDDQVPEITRKMKGKPQYPYTFSRGQDFPVVLEE